MYTYREFYESRGTQSFWLTDRIGYRIGATLALFASRLRLSPNAVSFASFVVAIGGALAVVLLNSPAVLEICVLLLSGHLSYGLDCADGVLARVTGQSSVLGMYVDKMVDTLVEIMVPIVLTIELLRTSQQSAGFVLTSLGVFLGLRITLAIVLWLRDALRTGMSRTVASKTEFSLIRRLRRLVGNLTADEVSFRTLLALAWGLGAMLWFYWFFAIASLLTLTFYLASISRERQAKSI